MRKQDELDLFLALRLTHAWPPKPERPMADEVGAGLGIHTNRVHYVLDKWAGKGWWNYGVSLRTGWFTDAAPQQLMER
jgi:hypothetical protein